MLTNQLPEPCQVLYLSFVGARLVLLGICVCCCMVYCIVQEAHARELSDGVESIPSQSVV